MLSCEAGRNREDKNVQVASLSKTLYNYNIEETKSLTYGLTSYTYINISVISCRAGDGSFNKKPKGRTPKYGKVAFCIIFLTGLQFLPYQVIDYLVTVQ